MTTLAMPIHEPRETARRGATDWSVERWGPRLAFLVVLIWGAGCVVGFRAALAALTVLGFALTIGGLGRPFFGLLGVSMLCTLDSMTRTYLMLGGLLRWNTFNYWLLAVMLLGMPALLRQRDPHTRFLQAFLAVALLGLAVTPRPITGFAHLLNVVTVFGLVFYVLRMGDDRRAWYWLGLIDGLLAAVGGLLYYLQRAGLPRIDNNGLSYFPLTAIFIICLAMPFAQGRPRWQRNLAILAAINYCWVFLTGSRGGLLVAVFCIPVLLGGVRGLARRTVLIAVAAVLGLAILSQFADLRQTTVHRVEKLFDSDTTLANRTSGRYDLALGAWYIFLDHPLGVGTGGYEHYWIGLSSQEDLSGFGHGTRRAAHSAWMRTIAENGIPGILILAGYVGSFALVGWQKRRQGLLPLGLLVALGLGAAFVTTEFSNKGLWLLAAGATVMLHRRSSCTVIPEEGTLDGR